MTYVPLGVDQARLLRQSGALDGPLPAHCVTPGLLRAHDLTADTEDAEYTALAYAGVSALLTSADWPRIVVAAEVSGEPTAEDPYDPFGRVSLDRLAFSQITSLFADEPDSAERLARARGLAAGLDFEEVVDTHEIESLLDASDLLWFAPSELDRLLDPAA
jgi:hypothetical protein